MNDPNELYKIILFLLKYLGHALIASCEVIFILQKLL